jgi:hypothetical protein
MNKSTGKMNKSELKSFLSQSFFDEARKIEAQKIVLSNFIDFLSKAIKVERVYCEKQTKRYTKLGQLSVSFTIREKENYDKFKEMLSKAALSLAKAINKLPVLISFKLETPPGSFSLIKDNICIRLIDKYVIGPHISGVMYRFDVCFLKLGKSCNTK